MTDSTECWVQCEMAERRLFDDEEFVRVQVVNDEAIHLLVPSDRVKVDSQHQAWLRARRVNRLGQHGGLLVRLPGVSLEGGAAHAVYEHRIKDEVE